MSSQRGKTTPSSTPGSFAPHAGQRSRVDLDQGSDEQQIDAVLNATTAELDQFMNHPNPKVRATVATRRDAGYARVSYLSGDDDAMVRCAVVDRWDIPAADDLADDPNVLVRVKYASRPDIDDETRDRVLADPSVQRVLALTNA